METVKEIAQEALLNGEHINKGAFHAKYGTFTLTQRIEEIRKDGWNVKSKPIPGKKGMVEYWLEESEIERIRSGMVRVEQSPVEEVEAVEMPSKSFESEDKAYYTEQLGIGLLGGHNY